MGDLISPDRLLEKQIRKEAEREAKRLYAITAGFSEPEPMTEEQRQIFDEGMEV